MNKLFVTLIAMCFFMSACKPSVSVVQTAMAKTQEAEQAKLRGLFGLWTGNVKVTFSPSGLIHEDTQTIFIYENCEWSNICLDNTTLWDVNNQWQGMQYSSDDSSENRVCFISFYPDHQICVAPTDDKSLEYSLTGPDFTVAGFLYKQGQEMTPNPPKPPIALPEILFKDWNARALPVLDQARNFPISVRFKISKKCLGFDGFCLYVIPLEKVNGLESEIYPLRSVTYNQYCFAGESGSFCFVVMDEKNIFYECKKGWIGDGKVEEANTGVLPPPEYTSCPGTLESQLFRGSHAYVTSGLGASTLRSGPGLNNSIEGNIQPGTVIQILDGPECSDSYTWWRVLVLDTNDIGWVVENNSEEYFVKPCQSSSCETTVQVPFGSDKCDPVGFLQYYFDIIEKGNLKRSYELLSDRFIQKHHSDGYQPYLNWWRTVKKVEILSVHEVSRTDTKVILSTELSYYFKNGQVDTYDLTEFTIAWDSPDESCMMDDEVLIKGYR